MAFIYAGVTLVVKVVASVYTKLKMDDYPSNVAWNPENITSNETRAFSKVLNNTMMDLTPEIVNSKMKFGIKMANITRSKKLYTLGQCTLDFIGNTSKWTRNSSEKVVIHLKARYCRIQDRSSISCKASA